MTQHHILIIRIDAISDPQPEFLGGVQSSAATLYLALHLWEPSEEPSKAFWECFRMATAPTKMAGVQPKVETREGLTPDPWESAYLRFETPEQEIRKFTARLNRLGAHRLPREAAIVELFCGRGNGLVALQRLGFTHLEGVDLSPRLIAEYKGSANCIVADCRKLPFEDRSKDLLIVQGGLHHLPNLPGDIDQTFSEMRRVLRKDGRVMFVEPWRTPFLTFVHFVSEIPVVRRLSNKMDAFATMTEHETRTYWQWLGQPELVKKVAHSHFVPVHESFAWGKWNFVATPR